jgi:hypothetical protein
VASFLPPGPNVVAQALLADSTLRSLTAAELSRLLHVSVKDASAGIGAIVGMINRTAHGSAGSALRPEPSLGGAVGPFLSLDQAMSRFGSHMGPIVRSPSPSPVWSPDSGADRQYGAGALVGWAGALEEAGDVDPNLWDAATTLEQFLTQNGCNADPAGICGNFQNAWNVTGAQPALTVDDKYGPATRAALQSVLNQVPSGPIAVAPAACYAAAGTSAPAATAPAMPMPGASTPTAPAPLAASVAGGSNRWMLAALAVAAGLLVLKSSKKKPRWARKAGL